MSGGQLVQCFGIRQQYFSITDDRESFFVTFAAVATPCVIRRNVFLDHITCRSVVVTTHCTCIFAGITVHAVFHGLQTVRTVGSRCSRPITSVETYAGVETHFTVGIHLPDIAVEMIVREITRSGSKVVRAFFIFSDCHGFFDCFSVFHTVSIDHFLCQPHTVVSTHILRERLLCISFYLFGDTSPDNFIIVLERFVSCEHVRIGLERVDASGSIREVFCRNTCRQLRSVLVFAHCEQFVDIHINHPFAGSSS